MHDRFKKRFQASQGSPRLRQQIALEAARRMFQAIGPGADDPSGWLRDASEGDFYTAKRKAAAVLGHRVRPGDLPSDSEVREQVLALARSRSAPQPRDEPEDPDPGDDPPGVEAMADHLDRFAIYKLRLDPLEGVKQDPRTHPEGDALYHSLQVFERARQARPYDEDFLIAALLHDVGKAIDARDHVAAAVEALRGAVSSRTLWLIEHHRDPLARRDQPLSPRVRKTLEGPDSLEDLELLRDLDDAGRVAGVPVGTVDQALDYLRDLEREAFLDD